MSSPHDTIVALTDIQRTCVLSFVVSALESGGATIDDFDRGVAFARSVYPSAAGKGPVVVAAVDGEAG